MVVIKYKVLFFVVIIQQHCMSDKYYWCQYNTW